jgi:hypothetical protein
MKYKMVIEIEVDDEDKVFERASLLSLLAKQMMEESHATRGLFIWDQLVQRGPQLITDIDGDRAGQWQVWKVERLGVRSACQQRIALSGAEAQALEHALSNCERELRRIQRGGVR